MNIFIPNVIRGSRLIDVAESQNCLNCIHVQNVEVLRV